MFQLSTRYWVV